MSDHECNPGADSSPRLLDLPAVLERTGTKAAKHFTDVTRGLMPPPIRRGPKYSRYVDREVDAVVRARIAGADDEAIRALVARLVAARQEGVTHAG